jgi:hypothetical protein
MGTSREQLTGLQCDKRRKPVCICRQKALAAKRPNVLQRLYRVTSETHLASSAGIESRIQAGCSINPLEPSGYYMYHQP